MFNRSISTFFTNKYMMGAVLVSIALLLVATALLYVDVLQFEDNIILHLDIQQRIDALGSAWHIWLMLIGIAVIMLTDILLSRVLYNRERVLSYMVMYTAPLVGILAVIVAYHLTLIN